MLHLVAQGSTSSLAGPNRNSSKRLFSPLTPVRALIDEATSTLPGERLAVCVVTQPGPGALRSVAFGDPESAWSASAEVSAAWHIRYLDAAVRRILALLPERYDDMWTGAKGVLTMSLRTLPLGRPGARSYSGWMNSVTVFVELATRRTSPVGVLAQTRRELVSAARR